MYNRLFIRKEQRGNSYIAPKALRFNLSAFQFVEKPPI